MSSGESETLTDKVLAADTEKPSSATSVTVAVPEKPGVGLNTSVRPSPPTLA